MEKIAVKSIGFLIDELCTVSQKCWWAQEGIMDKSLSDEERLKNAERAQELNNRRNQLIRAIDEKFGDASISPTSKTYHTYFEKKD
jgi:hypothetical protein